MSESGNGLSPTRAIPERPLPTSLTRDEQLLGIERVRAWGNGEARIVASLPAEERDTVLLLAALLDIHPEEPHD